MSWIKLAIHRRHDKVLLIADLSGATPISALAAAIEWFRWVDEHVDHDADTSISLSGFREVTAWPDDGLSRAMCHADVDWLEKGPDGRLRPTRTDPHFGASEKARAQNAKRQKRYRKRNGGVTQSVTQNAPEKIRREEKPPPPPQSPVSVAEPSDGGGGGGEVVRMNPDQHAVYMALLTKPVWFVADAPWIDPVTCKDLALLPTTSMALVEYWMAQARSKRKGLKDAAGFVIARLKRPDMALAANMKTQSLTVSQIRERAT